MYPHIHVLGRDFPMYGLCAFVGLLFAAGLLVLTLRKRRDYSKIHIVNIPLAATVGAFLGAHLVYFVTRFDYFLRSLQHLDVVFASWDNFWAVFQEMFGGMVFYGGLLGAILAAFIYCKAAKVDFSLYADIFAPAIPLFHAFGRIGCVFAGCCYGMEASWGLTYPVGHNDLTVAVTRLPVPLIEAGCNLLLMAVLLILQHQHLKKGSLLAIYFIVYAAVRFADEFFRGDTIRGILFGLSTSQWISIVVLLLGIYMLLNRYRFQKKDTFGYRVPIGEVPEGYVYNRYAGAVAPWEQYRLKNMPEGASVDVPSADTADTEVSSAESDTAP